MEFIIAHYAQNRHTTHGNSMIAVNSTVKTRADAEKAVGRKAMFSYTDRQNNQKTITGKVASAHGNKGAIRILFEKGMPGQAIGKKILVQ
ncbi:50S ribosomal protein L35ae [Candidatus Woesearchaeota archaeon]|nr:50S ribosomal protein L35ae [Candidatus Woesearchaeota archaeon]